MSQHCRANPCCGDRPCTGVPVPQDRSGLWFHNSEEYRRKADQEDTPSPVSNVVGFDPFNPPCPHCEWLDTNLGRQLDKKCELHQKIEDLQSDLQTHVQGNRSQSSMLAKICDIIRAYEDDDPVEVARERMAEIEALEQELDAPTPQSNEAFVSYTETTVEVGRADEPGARHKVVKSALVDKKLYPDTPVPPQHLTATPDSQHPLSSKNGGSCHTTPAPQDHVEGNEASRKLSLWFFRDLSGEQRGKLFALFGLNDAQKDTNHGYQAMGLAHVVRLLATTGGKDNG